MRAQYGLEGWAGRRTGVNTRNNDSIGGGIVSSTRGKGELRLDVVRLVEVFFYDASDLVRVEISNLSPTTTDNPDDLQHGDFLMVGPAAQQCLPIARTAFATPAPVGPWRRAD